MPAFRHVADAHPHDAVRRPAGDVPAGEQHLPAARRGQADDRAHGRGLADAVAAEHGGDAAGRHLQVDALQDMTLAVIGMQALDPQHHSAPPR